MVKDMKLKERLLSEIRGGRLTFKNAKAMCDGLGMRYSERDKIKKALAELEDEGEILKDDKGGYATPEQLGAFRGTVQGNERGFAFIIPEGGAGRDGDYFVPRRALNGAMNRDKVLAVHRRGTEDEAFVVKILERGQKTVVGTFERDKRAGYVLPDDKRFDSDVYVPLSLCMNAKPGDKVLAEITSYPKNAMVGGKIVEVLGESGDFYTEELSIIRSYGLTEQFSAEAERQAEEASRQPVTPGDRRDLRDILTVTIDGEDTRDIDDAVSLQRDGDRYVLGVHIADVSHYVKLNSTLDREAYARGTSVYFPDTVLPMLPKALSNGACSLNEGEDRYAVSCFMTFDDSGKKLDYKICRSLIRSDRRMTYTAVTAILEGDRDVAAQYADVAPMLRHMETLCLKLEKRRKAAGSINLDVKEAHIYVDEQGKIVIPDYERSVSHRMIEQFMVSTNESVADYAFRRKAPFLYRVHEQPSPEKASTFFSFLRDLGVSPCGNTYDLAPMDFQKILSSVEDRPFSSVVNRVRFAVLLPLHLPHQALSRPVRPPRFKETACGGRRRGTESLRPHSPSGGHRHQRMRKAGGHGRKGRGRPLQSGVYAGQDRRRIRRGDIGSDQLCRVRAVAQHHRGHNAHRDLAARQLCLYRGKIHAEGHKALLQDRRRRTHKSGRMRLREHARGICARDKLTLAAHNGICTDSPLF